MGLLGVPFLLDCRKALPGPHTELARLPRRPWSSSASGIVFKCSVSGKPRSCLWIPAVVGGRKLIFGAAWWGAGLTDKSRQWPALYGTGSSPHCAYPARMNQPGFGILARLNCVSATEIPYQCRRAFSPFQPGPTIIVLSGPCRRVARLPR